MTELSNNFTQFYNREFKLHSGKASSCLQTPDILVSIMHIYIHENANQTKKKRLEETQKIIHANTTY